MELDKLRNLLNMDIFSQNMLHHLQTGSDMFFERSIRDIPPPPKLQRQSAVRYSFSEPSLGIVKSIRSFPRLYCYILNWIHNEEKKDIADIIIFKNFLLEMVNNHMWADENNASVEAATIYLLRYLSQDYSDSKSIRVLHNIIEELLSPKFNFMRDYCECIMGSPLDRYDECPGFKRDIQRIFNRILTDTGYSSEEEYADARRLPIMIF